MLHALTNHNAAIITTTVRVEVMRTCAVSTQYVYLPYSSNTPDHAWWCLEASHGEFWMMNRGIIWSPPHRHSDIDDIVSINTYSDHIWHYFSARKWSLCYFMPINDGFDIAVIIIIIIIIIIMLSININSEISIVKLIINGHPNLYYHSNRM